MNDIRLDAAPDTRFGRRTDVLVFAALAGLAATMLAGYGLGRVNNCQFSQLLHMLDSRVLAADFYVVNTVESFGIRSFYIRTLTLLCRLIPLPVVFFLLTWLQNAAVALVTFVVARKMFDRSELAAMTATILVMSVHSVSLGKVAYLVMPETIPTLMATALALYSIWQGIGGKPLLCAAFAVPAFLIHPLVGVLAGLLGLGASGFGALFGIGAEGRAGRVKTMVLSLALGAALAGIAGLSWLTVSGQHLMSAREYVDLYALFRIPHHAMPSYFISDEWIAMVLFLAAAGISWTWWFRQPTTDRPVALRMTIVAGLILLLWFGGWLFVEVFPSRFWATLQPFRLVFIIKWFGLMLFAGTIARLATGTEPGQPAVAAMMFFPIGVGQPHAVLWAHIAELGRRRLRGTGEQLRWFAITVALLVSIGIVFIFGFSKSLWPIEPNKEFLVLIVLGLVALCWLTLAQRRHRYQAALVVVGLAAALVVMNKYYPLRPLGSLLRDTKPFFTLNETTESRDRIAAYCRDSTPEDAIFLVPPRFELFRSNARRAVVIEFKCLILSDRGLLDWRQRLTDCYGEVSARGFNARDEMERNYRRITDEQILAVADKYGASFAVLHQATQTGFPVVFEEGFYKIIRIAPEEMAPTVSLVVFRAAPGSVEHADAYFNWLLQQHLPGAILGTAYVSPVDSLIDVEEAIASYRQSLNMDFMSDLGQHYMPWQGIGPDGVPVTVLFFTAQPTDP